MIVKVFRSSQEKYLYRLYNELYRYFNPSTDYHMLRESETGFYDRTGNILPLLFQAFVNVWSKKFTTKEIKYEVQK